MFLEAIGDLLVYVVVDVLFNGLKRTIVTTYIYLKCRTKQARRIALEKEYEYHASVLGRKLINVLVTILISLFAVFLVMIAVAIFK